MTSKRSEQAASSRRASPTHGFSQLSPNSFPSTRTQYAPIPASARFTSIPSGDAQQLQPPAESNFTSSENSAITDRRNFSLPSNSASMGSHQSTIAVEDSRSLRNSPPPAPSSSTLDSRDSDPDQSDSDIDSHDGEEQVQREDEAQDSDSGNEKEEDTRMADLITEEKMETMEKEPLDTIDAQPGNSNSSLPGTDLSSTSATPPTLLTTSPPPKISTSPESVNSTSFSAPPVSATLGPGPATSSQESGSTVEKQKQRCTPEEIAEKKRIAQEKRKLSEERKRREREEEEQRLLGAARLAQYGYGVYAPASSSSTNAAKGAPQKRMDSTLFEPAKVCSEEQIDILKLVKEGRNVFITGSAGVGKSLVISEISRMLKFHGAGFSTTAPTGIAAVNVEGQTLHSWAGVGLGNESISELHKEIIKNRWKVARWRETDVLIIDEISMVHPMLFYRLDMLGRLIRERSEPFGGIQLVVCGDFFQLPPIIDEKVPEEACIRCGRQTLKEVNEPTRKKCASSELPIKLKCSGRENEDGKKEEGCGFEYEIPIYSFETTAWAECKFEIRELTKVFRQSNSEFVEVLGKIRRGVPDQACIDFFKSCGNSLREGMGSIRPTMILPLRENVESVNKREFDLLREAEYTFEALDEAQGSYAKIVMSSRVEREQLRDVSSPEAFGAKVGTQVILLWNLDAASGLVNGTRGVITGYCEAPSEETIRSSLSSKNTTEQQKKLRKTIIGTDEWKAEAIVRYLKKQRCRLLPKVYFAPKKSVACEKRQGITVTIMPFPMIRKLGRFGAIARTQLPLAHAWAITVHKSQGQTLDAAEVRVNRSFATGQAYVALSRCRTPDGMLVDPFLLQSIKTSSTVKKFYDLISKKLPFPVPNGPSVNPLTFLNSPTRYVANLEPVFRSSQAGCHPLASSLSSLSSSSKSTSDSVSTSSRGVYEDLEPASVTSSSRAPNLLPCSGYHDHLFEGAKNYIEQQKNVGASGGFSFADENGFIEAARFAFALAQGGGGGGGGGGGSSLKRVNSDAVSSVEEPTGESPSKRSRTNSSDERIEDTVPEEEAEEDMKVEDKSRLTSEEGKQERKREKRRKARKARRERQKQAKLAG
ncbi:hypothetical protein JCM3765_005655 [Sporobolomyces pararoseus]